MDTIDQNCFGEAHPTFSAYVVIGGNYYDMVIDGGREVKVDSDDSFTVRLFALREEAVKYGRNLLSGEDDWASIDDIKYDYARVHTMGNDGRISPNSYFITV